MSGGYVGIHKQADLFSKTVALQIGRLERLRSEESGSSAGFESPVATTPSASIGVASSSSPHSPVPGARSFSMRTADDEDFKRTKSLDSIQEQVIALHIAALVSLFC